MSFRSNTASSSGFTLMELMVVVGIIAFVTAATMPSFSMALLQNRQREAGSLIVKAVFTARSGAPRAGKCYRVIVGVDSPGLAGGHGGSVQVDQFINPTADCALPSVDVVATDWIPISFASVGGVGDRPKLVGLDVAISRVLGTNCAAGAANTNMFFNPDGSLYFTAGLIAERFYEINAFLSDGVTPAGTHRFVHIATGGAVKYTTHCP